MIFGTFLIFSTISIILFMPETKNKTTNEIVLIFEKNRTFFRQSNDKI